MARLKARNIPNPINSFKMLNYVNETFNSKRTNISSAFKNFNMGTYGGKTFLQFMKKFIS